MKILTGINKPALIFAIAILIRIAFIAIGLFYDFEVGSDFVNDITHVAKNIASGKGFTADGITPWAWKGPLYPLLASAFVLFFGENFIFLRVFFISLDLLCVLFIFQLGRLAFNERTGLIASFIWALYVPAPWLAFSLNYEVLVTVLLLAAFVLLLSKGLKNAVWALTAGLVLSLATLSRPSTLWLGPFLLLVGLFKVARGRIPFSRLCVFALFSLLGILPWTVRNYYHFHMWIPVAVSSSPGLFSGSEKTFIVETKKRNVLTKLRLKDLGFAERPEEERWYLSATRKNYLRQWREDPKQLFDLYLTKSYQLFFYSDSKRWDHFLMLINLPIALFSVLGIFIAARRASVSILLLLGTAIYFWLVHLPFLPLFRLLLPAFPIFVLFSSYALDQTVCLSFERDRPNS